jgi:subtilisin
MPEYILLPKTGIKSVSETLSWRTLLNLPHVRSTQPPVIASIGTMGLHQVKVIDSINESGPKLVEIDNQAANKINQPDSPLRAVPLVIYNNPEPGYHVELASDTDFTGTTTIKCIDQKNGAGVSDATVLAFTDFTNRKGGKGITDINGEVHLFLDGDVIEKLFVYPLTGGGHWGAFRKNEPLSALITITLTPVDLNFVDSVRYFYRNSMFDSNSGVVVGVLDTGIGPHADLNIAHGLNTVTGELAVDWQDGQYHGTHVAGLIGAKNRPPNGLRGVAPGVALHSYRVFGKGGGGATNYAIMKAIIKAEGFCDILNLSLGSRANSTFNDADAIVIESIQSARNNGMTVIVAAGNDGRQPVGTPANYPDAIAVSAMGVEGTFPVGSLDENNIMRPPTSAQYDKEFIAAFSNIGPEISVTGPGVGTLSTLPNQKYGPLSGTSMAAPVVTGALACLLSQHPEILGMQRNQNRSKAIERLLLANCIKRGFGLDCEGYGLPNPTSI